MFEVKGLPPLPADFETGQSFAFRLAGNGFYADKHFMFYHENGMTTAFYEKTEMLHSKQAGFDSFGNPEFLDSFQKSVADVLRRIDLFIKQLSLINLAKQPTAQLTAILEDFWELDAHVFALFNATQPQNIDLIEEKIRTELAGLIGIDHQRGDIEEALGVLTAPPEISKISLEELDWLELVKAFKRVNANNMEELERQVPELFQRLRNHFDVYRLLMLGDDSWDPKLEELFERLVRDSKKALTDIEARIGILRQATKQLAKTKQALINKLHPSESLIKYCNAVSQLGHLRLKMRVEGFIPLIFNGINIYGELSRRLDITVRELQYATAEEARSLFTNEHKVSLAELKKRARDDTYLMRVENHSISFYFGNEASKVFLQLVQPVVNEDVSELKGSTAMAGTVTGQVHVFRWGDDINKAINTFTNTTILVAGQTRPQLMDLIRNSVGIITDEGGITSHAAIVARELKLPCIVGTKHATKILHTGDLVELNADKGIIKIIKRTRDGVKT